MNSLWIFRTNMTNLEDYHQYTTLEDFKQKCWDFYILMGIWLLENKVFDECIVWRLSKKERPDITFKVCKRYFTQKFVKDFSNCFHFKSPQMTFFRGGFVQYDNIVRSNPYFFGKKLYLGASSRITPTYKGKYDKILVECNTDLKNIKKSIPFLKTSNPNIFKPIDKKIMYDICIPANFSQMKYKGLDFLFCQISKSKILSKLKIISVGNQEKHGRKIANKYGLSNITFSGYVDRFKLNEILNQSRFGIVASDQKDGCPRTSTEILCSGTPLLVRNTTRLLKYYLDLPYVISFDDKNLEKIYIESNEKYDEIKKKISDDSNSLSMDTICNLNLKYWS